jgi:hypothetical protein
MRRALFSPLVCAKEMEAMVFLCIFYDAKCRKLERRECRTHANQTILPE